MAIDLTTLDAHEQPSEILKKTWKAYSRTEHSVLQNHPDIDDVRTSDEFRLKTHIPAAVLKDSFKALQGDAWAEDQVVQNAPVYYHPLLPGSSSLVSRYIASRGNAKLCAHRSPDSPRPCSAKHPESSSREDGAQRSK